MSETRMEWVHASVFGDMNAAFGEPGHPVFHLTAPSHTLIECRTIADGLYQVTGQGGGIHLLPDTGNIFSNRHGVILFLSE